MYGSQSKICDGALCFTSFLVMYRLWYTVEREGKHSDGCLLLRLTNHATYLDNLPSVLILNDVTCPELGDAFHDRVALLFKPGLVLGSDEVMPLRQGNVVVQVILVVIAWPDAYQK